MKEEALQNQRALKALLAEGKIQETIDRLRVIAEESDNNKLLNAVIHQANNFKNLQEDRMKDVLSSEEIQIRRNKIIQSLLHLTDRLSEEAITAPKESPAASNGNDGRRKWLLTATILIVLAAGFFWGSKYLNGGKNDPAPAVQGEVSTTQAEVTELQRLANEAFRSEAWNEARDYFSRLVRIEPGNPVFLEKYGYSLYQLNLHDQAIEAFDKAIRATEGKAPQLFFFRGNAFLEKRNYQAALDDFDRLIRQSPNHRAGFNQRGLVHLGLGNKEKACADFRRAEALGNRSGRINIERYCNDSR